MTNSARHEGTERGCPHPRVSIPNQRRARMRASALQPLFVGKTNWSLLIGNSLVIVSLLIGHSLAHATNPRLTSTSPPGAQRGTELDLRFNGNRLEDAQEIVFYG